MDRDNQQGKGPSQWGRLGRSPWQEVDVIVLKLTWYLGATCLFAAYLLQFHQDITDRVALSLGMISRPVYIVNSKSHAAMIALR